MLVAVSLLAISLSFLIYRHPLSTWPALFAPAQDTAAPSMRDQSQKDGDEQDTPTEQQQRPTDRGTEHIPLSTLSPATTPKAAAHTAPTAPAVPTFTLDAHSDNDDDSDDEDNLPPPSFPALNSAQRASAPTPSFSMTPPALSMPPPPAPNRMAPPPKPAASSFMAPPPRVAASSLRPLPTAQSQRVPTNGPLPNRGPVPNRGPPVSNGSLGVPAGVPTPKTPNARGKVLLSPGHSPLDWANLQRSGNNLSGVDSLVRVTPAMLKEKNGRKGKPAWSSYQGKVYNISPYLPYHPGGEGELRRAAGKDGTKLFMEVHPWVNWENMLGECMVGIMVSEEPAGAAASSLEDMD